MAEANKPTFDITEKTQILAALDMLMKSHKRAEHQMRTTNREAIADAIKLELHKIAATAQKVERLL